MCIIVVTMYIIKPSKKTKSGIHQSVLLIEGYRENGKVKHRTLANLTHWPKMLVTEFEKLLQGGKVSSLEELRHRQGKSCGGLIACLQLCKALGISKALGAGRYGLLSILLVLGRILSPGRSRLGLVKWAENQAVEEVLGIKSFNEEHLYRTLQWLAETQEDIEQKLFKIRHKEVREIYLYDVTSSYLEGVKNELAAYGYNRDKKKGKLQIVVGLLMDSEGYPISVEVFEGNSSDNKTVKNQLKKLKENFGVERVIFVGDRGMIKQAQIDEIISAEYKWHYITAITKSQIESLLSSDIVQLDLFDEELVEVEEGQIRYILRRNPQRVQEIQEIRSSKIKRVSQEIDKQNKYLSEHKRAREEVALKKVKKLIVQLKLEKVIKCIAQQRKLRQEIDKKQLEEIARLDGCYVIKTDVPKELASKEVIHGRYKDLAKVEEAFRTIKTGFEEIRPIYVRKELRTRGHVFVCMLAYLVIKHVWDKTKELGYSREFIFESLEAISYVTYNYKSEKIKRLPAEFLDHQEKIIEALKIKLPDRL